MVGIVGRPQSHPSGKAAVSAKDTAARELLEHNRRLLRYDPRTPSESCTRSQSSRVFTFTKEV